MFYKIFSGLLMILFPLLVIAGDSEADSSGVTDSSAVHLQVYEVFGMDCPGCHGGVEKLVKKIPGILNAEANWEQQELKIWIDPVKRIKDEVIYDAIKRANFTPGKRIK